MGHLHVPLSFFPGDAEILPGDFDENEDIEVVYFFYEADPDDDVDDNEGHPEVWVVHEEVEDALALMDVSGDESDAEESDGEDFSE